MEKISQLWVLNLGDLNFRTHSMPLQANKQNHKDKELIRRRHQKEEKIQDISEENRAPKTPKQTVTLTTVAGQKVQEKFMNGIYRLQRRNTIKNKSSS